jgi:hypothetical protein
MTDFSQDRKRTITYRASPQGIEIAERALLRLGFASKSNFAKSNLLSRSTVTKFFLGQPIQLDPFKRICQTLKLDWQKVVAEQQEEKLLKRLLEEKKDYTNPDNKEEAEQGQKFFRQVTVLDKESQVVKAVIRLEGDFNSINNDLSVTLQAIFREFLGDTITITDIKEGSIKLIIEGSEEDINPIVSLFKSGELPDIGGFPVEDVQRAKV